MDSSRSIAICEYMEHRFPNDVLVDIRDHTTYSLGTLPGAVNVPYDNLGALYDLPQDKKICVFCQKGETSGEIVELLLAAGYDAYELAGGYRAYLLGTLG